MDDAERLFSDAPSDAREPDKQKDNDKKAGTTKTNIEEDVKKDVDLLREELIRLSDDGELDRKKEAIKKASEKTLRKWYAEVEKKRERKANEFLTDLLLSKFAGVLGGLQAIEDEKVLAQELQKDELLKRDVMRLVTTISPYIPLLGFISGSVTVATHVMNKKTN